MTRLECIQSLLYIPTYGTPLGGPYVESLDPPRPNSYADDVYHRKIFRDQASCQKAPGLSYRHERDRRSSEPQHEVESYETYRRSRALRRDSPIAFPNQLFRAEAVPGYQGRQSVRHPCNQDFLGWGDLVWLCTDLSH